MVVARRNQRSKKSIRNNIWQREFSYAPSPKQDRIIHLGKWSVIGNTNINRWTEQKWVKTKGKLIEIGRVMSIWITFIPKLTFAKVKTEVRRGTKLTERSVGKHKCVPRGRDNSKVISEGIDRQILHGWQTVNQRAEDAIKNNNTKSLSGSPPSRCGSAGWGTPPVMFSGAPAMPGTPWAIPIANSSSPKMTYPRHVSSATVLRCWVPPGMSKLEGDLSGSPLEGGGHTWKQNQLSPSNSTHGPVLIWIDWRKVLDSHWRPCKVIKQDHLLRGDACVHEGCRGIQLNRLWG